MREQPELKNFLIGFVELPLLVETVDQFDRGARSPHAVGYVCRGRRFMVCNAREKKALIFREMMLAAQAPEQHRDGVVRRRMMS